MAARNWREVDQYAKQILAQDRSDPEGLFLSGMVAKSSNRPDAAISFFSRCLDKDAGRYDAAIELAGLHVAMLQYGDAYRLIAQHAASIGGSPRYLQLAAQILSQVGKWDEAWPLVKRADELQPNVPVILACKAECATSLGKIAEAKELYLKLLLHNPGHQRNHYELSRLESARNDEHIGRMRQIISGNGLGDEGNIWLHYALGKELEDLEQWDDSFHHYKTAGDAAARSSKHDVGRELSFIDNVIETCDQDWFSSQQGASETSKTPVFIVGLPRTGTTLVERIVSSHSHVESIGETLVFENLLRDGRGRVGDVNTKDLRKAAKQNPRVLARDYMSGVEYLFGDKPMFIEKYTYNFLHLGLIARAFPDARLIHLQRNPMDACFAMYKQPFFSFAFTLEDLARYYPAYDRLMQHWRSLLGDRLVEVSYEDIVADNENQVRRLLDKLGLEFEQSCLDFDRNPTPSATASAVQVRGKVHSRSVGKWQRYEQQLTPLRESLLQDGFDV